MYQLRDATGEIIASYSDGFTLLEVVQDAIERKKLPHWYVAAWAATNGVWGQYSIIGIDHEGAVEVSGFRVDKE